MKKNSFSHDHEKIVAKAIAPIARELRLIDIADLIAMIRYEHHGNLSDLVTSAAELYFLPGTIRLGAGGDYIIDWGDNPKIVFDLEISPDGVLVYARLILEKDFCGIEINYIEFKEVFSSDQESTDFLRQSIEQAAFSIHKMNEVPNIYRAI